MNNKGRNVDRIKNNTLKKIESRKKLVIVLHRYNAVRSDYKSKAARMAESPFNIL